MKSPKLFLTLLLVAFISCEHNEPKIPAAVKDNIRHRVESGINTGIIVGVVNSQGTEFFSYGVKSKDNEEPIDENTVFEIASVSKTFTGLILAHEVLKGKLSLDDPLQRILPAGVVAPIYNEDTIRLIHLVNHTSGLPRMPDNFDYSSFVNPFNDYSEKQLFDFLKRYEPAGGVGDQYEYSNYGFGLLGHCLATTKDMTYEELLRSTVCDPLELTSTSTEFSPAMEANLARGHKLGQEVSNWQYKSTFAGAAGIRSTAKEMLLYLAHNMGLISSSLSEAMMISHVNTRKENQKPSIGLGWQLTERQVNQIVWHDGESGGYRSFAGFLKDGDLGVVVLTNSNADINVIGFHLLDSSTELERPILSVGQELRRIIDENGAKNLTSVYDSLKDARSAQLEFGENELHMLGNLYLDENETGKALAVFRLNVVAFPNSSEAYFDYGKALQKNGYREEAITAFRKSLKLYAGNAASLRMLEKLGANTEKNSELSVDDEILESYVGKYQLLPGLVLEVIKKGDQLMTRAEGKPEHMIYPESKTVFYYKSLPAQITFIQDKDGAVNSLTFIQEGEKITARRVGNK